MDDTYHIDVENPEANGYGYWVQYTEGCSNGKFLYDKIKLTLTRGVGDLRDIPLHTCTIVLNGRALLLSMPSVPHYMLYDLDKLYQVEKSPCTKTQQDHKVHANRIIKDPARQTYTVLFVLPEEMAFTTDFSNNDAAPPNVDKKIRITMREVKHANTSKGGAVINQIFFPGHWELRVISHAANARELELEQVDEDDFVSYFGGMHLGN